MESLDRPLIYRYQERIKANFRVPKEVRYLLILPELDVKGKTSPSIFRWLNDLDQVAMSIRSEIHVVFNSNVYGIVPLELVDTFPMGQFESIDFDTSCNNSYLEKVDEFFKCFGDIYQKCAILVPDYYHDQYQQEQPYLQNFTLNSLKLLLEPLYKSNIKCFKNINSIIAFFNEVDQ